MAYEDVIINTLVRAMEAKNAELVREGTEHSHIDNALASTCMADNESDRQLLESWSSLGARHTGFHRLLARVLGRA